MHTSSMASTSRLTTEESWEGFEKTCLFPMSDIRSIELELTPSTAPPPSPFKSQSLMPSKTSSAIYFPSSKYSFTITPRIQVDVGVWSSGADRVLSASCSDVQAFLTCARNEMVLPTTPSEVVFCLAALSVFYKVEDPVHWMFWSDEKKFQTAEVVDRIALHRPQLIISPVAWNGTREYLFILSGLHGPTSAPLFEKKWWYPILNPSKAPSPPRILNLRKRKPQQAEIRDPLGELLDDIDGIDVDEPPPKRSRLRRPSNALLQTLKSSNSQETQIESEIYTSPATIPVPLTNDVDGVSSPVDDSQSISSPESEKNGLSRETTRSRKRKAPRRSPLPSLTSDSSESRASSPPSMLLTPHSLSHSRNRSTSQASSQTVVPPEAQNRRSMSVLSAITAVEIVTIRKDSSLSVKGDNPMSDSEDEEEKEEGMITRGRANKARSSESRVAPPTKRPSRKRGTAKPRTK